jgi:hypothetical protein
MIKPPIGGFPGFARGANLFNAWVAAVSTGTNCWNDVWTETLQGNLTFASWAKAVAGSVEASFSFMEQAMATSLGTTAPPWVAIGSAKNAHAVHVSRPVDPAFRGQATLTLLNGQQKKYPRANVAARDAHTLEVIITDEDAQMIKKEQAARKDGQIGQYIGLVFTGGDYADPVAILMVSAEKFTV